MKFIATIHDRAVIVRIFEHLGLPTEELLPVSRAQVGRHELRYPPR